MMPPIYLDHNATTPVDPRVLEAMLPFFTEHYGNASSRTHAYGWAADEAVAQAREAVANLVGGAPDEIVFTSGATEAVNLALKGVAAAYPGRRRHLVTVETEHPAVLESCRALERQGFSVTYLPVAPDGRLHLDALEAALTDETLLVAVMWANNETGVLQPIDEVARIVRPRGILLLTDATQAAGKVPIDVSSVDLLALSSHKFYGPKGTGALWVRRRDPRVRLAPLVDGGGQERGLRGGTTNVPGIVGMGAAARLALALLPQEHARLEALRDHLEAMLCAAVTGTVIHGAAAPRLPQTTSVAFPGVRAAALLPGVRGLALSTGSACTTASSRPSHVLTAMDVPDETIHATLRLSLGRTTTPDEVETAAGLLAEAVEALRHDAALLRDAGA